MQVSLKNILAGLLFISCHQAGKPPQFIGGERIEGNNSPDSILNGHIKFYDTATKKLVAEADYVRGLKEGRYRQYYPDGKIEIDQLFTNGKENGSTKIFNDDGQMIAEENYYYGLRSGNAVRYKNGKLYSYSFNTLENHSLFYFLYDSLKGKRLPDLIKDLFFYTSSKYENVGDSSLNEEYFIYTPCPPKFNFKYGLVKVDKSLRILSTIKDFENGVPWNIFQYDPAWDNTKDSVAVRLEVSDSIHDDKITFLKVLKR
jgi:hypothetical protein